MWLHPFWAFHQLSLLSVLSSHLCSPKPMRKPWFLCCILGGVPPQLLCGSLCCSKCSTLVCLLVLVFYVCRRNIQFHVRMKAVSKLMMAEMMALSGTLAMCKIKSELFQCGYNSRCMYKVWHVFVLQLCMSDVLLTPGGCMTGHSNPLSCWMPTLQQLLQKPYPECFLLVNTAHREVWSTRLVRSSARGWSI